MAPKTHRHLLGVEPSIIFHYGVVVYYNFIRSPHYWVGFHPETTRCPFCHCSKKWNWSRAGFYPNGTQEFSRKMTGGSQLPFVLHQIFWALLIKPAISEERFSWGGRVGWLTIPKISFRAVCFSIFWYNMFQTLVTYKSDSWESFSEISE